MCDRDAFWKIPCTVCLIYRDTCMSILACRPGLESVSTFITTQIKIHIFCTFLLHTNFCCIVYSFSVILKLSMQDSHAQLHYSIFTFTFTFHCAVISLWGVVCPYTCNVCVFYLINYCLVSWCVNNYCYYYWNHCYVLALHVYSLQY